MESIFTHPDFADVELAVCAEDEESDATVVIRGARQEQLDIVYDTLARMGIPRDAIEVEL